MEELTALVSEKTGLSEEMSQQAVDVVLDYLKDKLPDPIAAQIDTVLEGGSVTDLGGIGKSLGGLL